MVTENKRVMGIDYGDSRIGVALSDPLGIMASPHTIISRTREDKDIIALLDIASDNDVSRIIIGLPLSMDGSLGPQAEKVKAFAAEMARNTDIPLVFKDERLSTVVARDLVQKARKTDRKTRYDAAAAALILQSYLDDPTASNLPPDESAQAANE
jgi:putative Holliday junction resolvase